MGKCPICNEYVNDKDHPEAVVCHMSCLYEEMKPERLKQKDHPRYNGEDE